MFHRIWKDIRLWTHFHGLSSQFDAKQEQDKLNWCMLKKLRIYQNCAQIMEIWFPLIQVNAMKDLDWDYKQRTMLSRSNSTVSDQDFQSPWQVCTCSHPQKLSCLIHYSTYLQIQWLVLLCASCVYCLVEWFRPVCKMFQVKMHFVF